MRRSILCSGVLSCIAISQANSQSLQESRDYCPIGATNCTSSYFDVSRSTQSVFAFILANFFDSDRKDRKHVGSRFNADLPAPRYEGLSNIAPSDVSGRDREQPRSLVFGNDEVSSAARRSNDGHEFGREVAQWEWPRFVIVDYQRRDGRPEQSFKPDEPKLNDGVGDRRNDDVRYDGPWPPTPGPSAPAPDIIDQPGTLTPEPSTLLLVATGIPFGLAWVRSRRRR